MNIAKSFAAGLRSVLQSPSLLFWLYGTSLVLAFPLMLAVRQSLQESIGSSLVHENLRQGFDLAWYGEFVFQRRGLGETFGPFVTGILPVLSNLDKLAAGEIFRIDSTILLAGIAFLLAWAFFAGGVIDRYARPQELHSRSRLFSQSAEYFFRFVRLLIISLLLYWAIFRWVAQPLYTWLGNATRDVTVEKTVMFYTLGVFALVAFLLLFASMVLDYAKIALVVEQRRSSLLAFIRGLRFVFSNPGQTLGLYLMLAGLGLVLVLVYSVVAPGPGQSTRSTIGLAFLVGQAYLLARLILKLWFLASQTALFQSAEAAPLPAPPVVPAN